MILGYSVCCCRTIGWLGGRGRRFRWLLRVIQPDTLPNLRCRYLNNDRYHSDGESGSG
jgi:hypothetical protein